MRLPASAHSVPLSVSIPSVLLFCCSALPPLSLSLSLARQTFLRSRNLPVPRWLDDQANDPAVNEKLQEMLKKAMQTQNQ